MSYPNIQLKKRYMLVVVLLLTLFFIPVSWSNQRAQAERPNRDRNVILLTWDGVRHEELRGLPDPRISNDDREPILSFLLGSFANTGIMLGVPGSPTLFTIGNSAAMSLPAYYSIFSGILPTCGDNDCGVIQEETLLERLIREGKMAPSQVASIASWQTMRNAVSSLGEHPFINAGLEPLKLRREGMDHAEDNIHERINTEQQDDLPPWPNARFDRYTWQHAMQYIQSQHPRFMHIGLNDSDEWGHQGHYQNYLATLRQYDLWLSDLFDLFKTAADLGDNYAKNTCFIVTTDHGRGVRERWTRHSNGEPTAFLSFLYAGCPFDGEQDIPFKRPKFSTHLDIRPTVENLFGLEAQTCTLCGKSLVK